ncbi:MAG: HNH endonuclease, partial [Longimicrobiales bacterium]
MLRKAAGDAGFDLALGEDGEWHELGASGLAGVVWVVPARGGALLAVAAARVLDELGATGWTGIPLPSGALGAVLCKSPADLYQALRRARVILANSPPLPQRRFEQRLQAISSTEIDAVVKQRVGQDLFREMLFEYWEGKCVVTGLAVPELLRASHAKPWAVSNDAERLDPYNGLLLAVHLD